MIGKDQSPELKCFKGDCIILTKTLNHFFMDGIDVHESEDDHYSQKK